LWLHYHAKPCGDRRISGSHKDSLRARAYTSIEWRPLCDAVLRLHMELESGPMFVGKASFSPGRVVEALGIEQPALHPIPTILERFRGRHMRS